jgi:hypothetical protein
VLKTIQEFCSTVKTWVFPLADWINPIVSTCEPACQSIVSRDYGIPLTFLSTSLFASIIAVVGYKLRVGNTKVWFSSSDPEQDIKKPILVGKTSSGASNSTLPSGKSDAPLQLDFPSPSPQSKLAPKYFLDLHAEIKDGVGILSAAYLVFYNSPLLTIILLLLYSGNQICAIRSKFLISAWQRCNNFLDCRDSDFSITPSKLSDSSCSGTGRIRKQRLVNKESNMLVSCKERAIFLLKGQHQRISAHV